MNKRIRTFAVIGIMVIASMVLTMAFMARQSARAAAPNTMYVSGRFLFDKFGVKFIPYGINHMTFWTDLNGALSCPEIAKTGANIIRLQWLTTGTADQLDTAITNCRASKMVVMPELHDATGDWSKLSSLVDYWVRPDIVAVLQKHQEYILINIGNEVGQTVSDADYIAGYTTAATRMRAAGIHVPLVIDASGYGQNINGLQADGPTLTQNDPDHNLMFSIHMWWPYEWGHTDQEVIDEIAQSVAMNLPLIIGEFGNEWDETAQGAIPYKIIIREAHLNQIGYLPWSWGPGNNPQAFLDMTTDQTYATLHGWGLEVAVTDPNSIKNIAVRPAWLDTAPPTAVPTTVPSNLVSFNKPVTVSSATGTNTGAKAVDGNGGTRWESLIADPQWIQIDLGSATPITNVDLVWEGAYATQYKLQISNDATTWTDAYTEWSGVGGTKTIAVNQTARYVRMNGTQRVNSAWGYSIWEFRVWSGTAVPTMTATKTFTPNPATLTRTNTAVVSSTATPTATRTFTSGPSATRTMTSTRTRTATAGPSLTPTQTVGASATRTPTIGIATITPTRTSTPTVGIPTVTPTSGAGACSPVTSTITAPFTFDGAGTFCWQSTNLGTYINSWNTSSVTINGVNASNLYMAAGSYPAKINGFWYLSYNSSVAWGHFEAK